MNEVVFDRDSAQRIAKAVKRVERQPARLVGGRGISATSAPRVALVYTQATAVSGFLYPATCYVFQPQASPDDKNEPNAPILPSDIPPGQTVPKPNQYSDLIQDCWVITLGGATLLPGVYVGVSSAIDAASQLPIFVVDSQKPPTAWVTLPANATQTTNKTLGRVLIDGVTVSGSNVLQARSGNFTTDDMGVGISGSGIPAGTVISAVDSFQTAAMSRAATATAKNVTVTITGGQVALYGASRVHIDKDTGALIQDAAVYVWSNQPLMPLTVESMYEALFIGTTVDGYEVWGIYVNYPDYGFTGATGADAVGNMFDNGICVQTGGSMSGGIGNIDGGVDS